MDKEVFFFDYKPTLEKAEGKRPTLVGYGIKWDVLSHEQTDEDTGRKFRSVFRNTTFSDLDGSEAMDLQAFYNHNYDDGYLARTDNGTFKVEKDDIGIRYSIELPDTQLGRDVQTLAERGDIKGASIGVTDWVMNWKKEPQGVIREFSSSRLVEISVVHTPAFPFTSSKLVAASLEEFLKSVEPVPELSTPLKDKAKRTVEIVRTMYR